ncbi:putative holin-like toxin [Mammaliicoccus sciuri]|nr:putative holin-like toxin [Mammaliicoccus sciuri]MCD8801639.1 putative holin-like toxin [Mammaliicoccus sciuri]
MIPIVDAIRLIMDFGTFIVVIFIGLVITIVKLNTKK